MLKEVIRRVRPNPPLESPPSRISIHPMGHLSVPSFRWWDGDKIPTHDKSPLLGLKSSSHSFLDSSLKDDLSATTIYTIKTTKASTTFLRHSNRDNPIEIARINWPAVVATNQDPDDKDPPSIRMKGCEWSKGPVFLKSGPNPNSSRKFSIPDYVYPMKWKHYGHSYWCTTSGIKGPIAILDLANGQEHINLTIYETLRDKSDPKRLPTYKGVSFLLLDYLIVTALLCVTDVSAWMKFANMRDNEHSSTVSSGDLRHKPSDTSLSTTVSALPQTPSKSYVSGLSPTDASCSRWYTDTPTIESSFKDYLSLFHSPTSSSSTESMHHPGASSSDTSFRKPIQDIPPVPPLLPQFSRPSTSSSSLFKPELSYQPDQPTTASIHSSQHRYPGLETEESLPFLERPPNVSKTIRPNGRSVSYRRPLPKPPRESISRRTQSTTPPPIDSPETSTHALRSLPPTPSESRSPVSGHSRIHSRSPPMTKASQEELTHWVHGLTDLSRDLPPAPLPETVVYDLPPPSYSSIYVTRGSKSIRIPTSSTTVPSTQQTP